MPTAKKAPATKKAATTTKATAAKAARVGFSAEERAAMRDHAREVALVSGRKGKADPAADLAEVLSKISAMAPSDRALAERVHAIVTGAAPELAPRTWYGMPAYALNGQVVCYFQDAAKFKSRYATLGFSDKARLDDGRMWPIAYALGDITKSDEAVIRALVKRATAR